MSWRDVLDPRDPLDRTPLSPTGIAMLALSLCGSIALVFALYALVDRKGVAISVAALSLGVATLSIAGVHMVGVIDQPSTPTASLGMRIYLLAFTMAATAIAVAATRDVFLTTKPVALAVVGLVGAALALEVGFIVFCAWMVQVRRAHRAKA